MLERIQNGRGGARPRSVVEGQHHLLVGERQGRREMLASNPRGRGDIDGEHARRPESLRVAGAGRLRFGAGAVRERGKPHQSDD